MKSVLLFLYFFLSIITVQAQQILTPEQFLTLVKKYHPVAQQASVGIEIAKAEFTMAQGRFDPAFQSELSRKELGGLLYYDQQITELKVPTWFGADLVAGIETLKGERTSATDTKGNSSYFGLSLPLVKGLVIDKRRAALQQAKVFQQLSVHEQAIVLNDLGYEAAKAYWNWWQQYHAWQLFENAVNNAMQRLNFVKKAFELGDRPAIDTVEALTQLQAFQIRQSELLLELNNARLDVSTFLWQQNNESYLLPETVLPLALPVFSPSIQLDSLMQQVLLHPELQQYSSKLKSLDIEKRLKFQSLLPSVYVKYNQLTTSHDVIKNLSTPWLQNTYRYGLAISVPLRLSEGRGEYKQSKLKIEQTRLETLNKRVLLQTKLQQKYNEWRQVKEQVILQQNAIVSLTALRRGEETKFLNGESSLFLINARELKMIEAQQKLIELQGKEQKAAAATLWAAGLLLNAQR